MFNKRTKTVMESINVVIDDTISEKERDDGEGSNLKKGEVEDNMSQDDEIEKESREKESTPFIPRRETRSTQGPSTLSPLRKFNLRSLEMKNLLPPRDRHQGKFSIIHQVISLVT